MTSTLAEALAEGRSQLAAAGVALPGLDAELLLAHAAGTDRPGLLLRGREPLPCGVRERFSRLLAERCRRVPCAYVTGEREFWSLRLAVDPRVLVPRPDTETLVEAALARVGRGARVADVGTGSGAVIIALAGELGEGSWWATDRSREALEVAGANAAAHGLGGRITFLQGDLLAPLARSAVRFDAIVSNPPYIPTGDIASLEPEIRDHEPRAALDGGPDGLRLAARLVAGAPALLRRGGWLLVEVGAGQADSVADLGRDSRAYDRLETQRDLAGIERVVAMRRG